MFDYEELFGVKKWRNDSPFMKEYIRCDNQILLLILLLSVGGAITYTQYSTTLKQGRREMMMSTMGIYCADDLI